MSNGFNNSAAFSERFNDAQRERMSAHADGLRSDLLKAAFDIFKECQIEDMHSREQCTSPGTYDTWLIQDGFEAVSFDGEEHDSMVFAIESHRGKRSYRIRFHIPIADDFDKVSLDAVEEMQQPEFICVEGPTETKKYAGQVVTRYVIDAHHEQMYRSSLDTGDVVEAYPTDQAVYDELEKGFASGIGLVISLHEKLVGWQLVHQKRHTRSIAGTLLNSEDL